MQSTFLITGAAGFIGSSLCEKLLTQCATKVIGIDNFDSYYEKKIKLNNLGYLLKSERFKFFEVNILESSVLESIMKKYSIDQVIHLAARPGIRASILDPNATLLNNINGTSAVLEAMSKTNTKDLIFASSSSVYGNNNTPFRESDSITSLLSTYAISKYTGENLCKYYSSNFSINTRCLRFFTVYGPRQRPEMAIHKFFRSAYNNNSLEIYGNGDSMRDYTYIDDILSGIISTVEYKTNFDIINLGSSHPISILSLIHEIEEIIGKKININFKSDQIGDAKVTYANINYAQKILNFNPKIGITDGLKLFNKWFIKENQFKR